MVELERRIRFARPAFERRHDDPGRDYGIGCVMMSVAVVGERGAVELEIFTGWYLPHVRERWRKQTDHAGTRVRCAFEGHGGALYVHSREPLFGRPPDADRCELLGGAPCWSDVSFSIGDELFDRLVTGGEEELFAALAERYEATFAVRQPKSAWPGDARSK